MVFEDVPAVGGLRFSMAQQKVQKSARCGKCQLGEVPVGRRVPVGDKIKPLDGRFFSNFVGVENLTPFSALNDLK